MKSGYSFTFKDDDCLIQDKKTKALVARVAMTRHNMFPLEIEDVGSINMVADTVRLSALWHRRHRHLHYQGLKTPHNE